MFLPAKLNFDDETKKWLDESIEWIISNIGKQYLLLKKNITTLDFFTKKQVTSEEEIREIAVYILKQMDFSEKIKFSVIFPDVSEFLNENNDNNEKIKKNKLSINDNGEISIGLYPENISPNPIRVVTLIVYELCKYILSYKYKHMGNNEELEELAELLSVFYGFGLFSAVSCKFYSSSAELNGYMTTHTWSYSISGYLNQDLYGYIMCSRDILIGNFDKKFFKLLPNTAKESYRRTKKYFKKYGVPEYFKKFNEAI